MKAVLPALALILGSVASADNYRCAERASDALAKNRLQYSVQITTVARIRDPKIVKDNDRVERVRISILSRNPRRGGSFSLDRPSFYALATTNDVHYQIDAKAAHGFRLGLYLDEGESSMTIKGVRGDINLNCVMK